MCRGKRVKAAESPLLFPLSFYPFYNKTQHFNSQLTPISKSLSASSKTRYLTVFSLNVEISRRWCIRRPGVAMMTSGLLARASNWASSGSPPTMLMILMSVNFAMSFAKRKVCTANSLFVAWVAAGGGKRGSRLKVLFGRSRVTKSFLTLWETEQLHERPNYFDGS